MKKFFLSLVLISNVVLLFACANKTGSTTMSLGGVEYPADFVRSGYYFDKASLSDATFEAMLSRIEQIDKPQNLGEVTLPDFSKFELTTMKSEEVTEAMIEAEIERERDKEITFTPVKTKREAKMTDKVIIDFKGFVNDKEFEGGAAEDYALVLGSGQFIPGFEEQIVGHKAGQKFSINVVFPEDYAQELAGKPARFDVTIKSMEEANTPEVNNDFVKSHTSIGATTVEEYREEMKSRIEKRNELMNNLTLMDQFMQKVVPECKFNPTEEGLAWAFSTIMSQIKMQAEQSGMSLTDALSSIAGSPREAYDYLKNGAASQSLEQDLFLDALANKYNIKLKEDDVKKWFNENMQIAMGYGNAISYDDYKTNVGYDMLYKSALQEKCFLKAIKDCKLTESTEENEENNESFN